MKKPSSKQRYIHGRKLDRRGVGNDHIKLRYLLFQSPFFSTMADECTDCSNQAQLSIGGRYITFIKTMFRKELPMLTSQILHILQQYSANVTKLDITYSQQYTANVDKLDIAYFLAIFKQCSQAIYCISLAIFRQCRQYVAKLDIAYVLAMFSQCRQARYCIFLAIFRQCRQFSQILQICFSNIKAMQAVCSQARYCICFSNIKAIQTSQILQIFSNIQAMQTIKIDIADFQQYSSNVDN